jgi:hypothetical protein
MLWPNDPQYDASMVAGPALTTVSCRRRFRLGGIVLWLPATAGRAGDARYHRPSKSMAMVDRMIDPKIWTPKASWRADGLSACAAAH